ncbi:MAG: EVE domain-containing protein [Bacteroidota bacterium]
MKTEPSAFSWEQLVKDGTTTWDGVRNYQARNNLKLMKTGDLAFIYHSVSDKEIVGIAKISKEYFQDPTTPDCNWVAVDLIPIESLTKKIKLSEIKLNPELQNIALLKQSRLSVIPLTKKEYEIIRSLGKY